MILAVARRLELMGSKNQWALHIPESDIREARRACEDQLLPSWQVCRGVAFFCSINRRSDIGELADIGISRLRRFGVQRGGHDA